MHERSDFLTTLQNYQETWCSDIPHYQFRSRGFDSDTVQSFLKFAKEQPNCFDRSSLPGHVTGSALVLNHDMTHVLLTHHKKLGMWLQLGGHADGHPVTHQVAMNEAIEESGIRKLDFLPYEKILFGPRAMAAPLPFDLDCHFIPANAREPAHYHYDVRYLLIDYSQEAPTISEESLDVRWFSLSEARRLTDETSMQRQFSKAEWVRKNYKF